ncbi:65-kDa microtubule-associated protein 5 [Citrus sinensis]|uniref:65-kDa microtubule-associated protein 5 n=1 Tax=Citrus sinensis TaxID=2711 RepID=A0ACB8KDN2_CITSI|nr:65-kDa microtubule-associated protein 5 [Citrus sinensis]
MPSPTTCGSLLQELQVIWDEIGESDSERDKMLLELEQDCLDIYRRKVERTRKYKADLHQSLADAEAEIACLVSALGEHASFSRQISAIRSILEDLRSKKEQRIKEFSGIQFQIAQISSEIAGNGQSINSVDAQVDECDLTVKKLGELKAHLRELQNEKNLRLQKVNNNLSTIHELSLVLSINFLETVNEVHPSLSDSKNVQSKSISNDTIARLTGVIHLLKQEKQQRLQKLQSLGNALIKLWDLLETPVNEQRKVDHVTSLVSSSVDEVSMLGCLALDVIEQMEVEVEHLNEYKASKMKELVFKRQHELEEIYKGVHMDVDSDAARQILISLIDSGNVDLSDLLSSMDDQIAKAKEESLSRKDILDKVEKWKHGAKEEQWLDDYEKDENRYSAGRGAHKNLKRAEKARILISKLPSVVENLIAKVKAWEAEKRIPFLYDKVPLLSILEEYTTQCQKREEEKRRCREQKRLQEQFAAEQEAIYGSRPSIKKPLCQSTSTNTMAGTPVGRRFTTPSGRHVISGGKERRESIRVTKPIPLNYVALPKDDSVSH